jgi:hypothetical protein
MTKFMVLYRAPVSAREQMANTTPEQAQAGMAAWVTWAAKAGAAVVDLGSPLAPATTLGGGSSADNDIAGFSILQAESVDAVAGVLTGHPHLDWGGSIEVLEVLTIPGMG